MTERLTPQNRLQDLIRKSIKINSVYPNEEEIGFFFADLLTKRGFLVDELPIETSRTNLLAKRGDGASSILFYGHMDTVPIINPQEWRADPLTPTIDGEKLHGLGASDMKSGIAAFIEASSNSDAYVKIFLAADEENISEGAWRAVSERKDFFNDVELIISAEPSFELGLNGITTARTGRYVYKIVFQGVAKHIIKYKEAIDAIKKLSDFGSRLYLKREKMFKSPDTVAQIRKVQGESVGMSVCGEAEAEIEVLLGEGDTVQNVRDKLQELTDDEVKLKPRKTPYLQGYSFSTFPYKDLIAEIIKRNTGKEMALHKRKSVGDDNVLATLKIPVIAWGPEGGNEHRANEYVNLDSVVLLSKMYKEFLDEVHALYSSSF